ncbi:MAG TPA: alanine racemase, partial [Candidatus Eremiobacteraceae bacterium]|nr:alanine racemase [Candidatus Eremiobacteraceae bacterium]
KTLDILIQANVAADDRQGVAPQRIPELAEQIQRFKNLRLCGIMAIGPRDSGQAGEAFGRAAAVYETLQQSNPDIRMLSIGMSGDLEVAVRAGSTMLRLGTALFGQRAQVQPGHLPDRASVGEG